MNSNMTSTGYLELFIGPMFSGKTSKLIEIYKQCTFCNIPVLVINHSMDTRYHEELLSSHDKQMIPCVMNNELLKLLEDPIVMQKIMESHSILINEGQWFPDLCEFTKLMLNRNKMVYIAGLDGDFKREKFGSILDLIPLCDKITKLTSLCSSCKNGTPGIFSKRLSDDTEQTVVGSDNYIPVCRKCYEN